MTRKFSLETDFMNLSVDDIVFGYLQHLATFHPEKQTLYVPVDKVSKEKGTIAEMIDKTARTVQNKINKLIENGLIIKEMMNLNGNETAVYVIPQTTIGRYQIIKDDMMWYLLTTRKQNILKIYVYLLNKYDWKAKDKEMYSFTNEELLAAIGYKASSFGSYTSVLTTILNSLKREGIIDFVEYCDSQYSARATMRKRLTFVAHNTSELPII